MPKSEDITASRAMPVARRGPGAHLPAGQAHDIRDLRPPEISYRWFRSTAMRLLDEASGQVSIDQSLARGRFHGTNSRNLLSAFRFLDLIDGDGRPTPALSELSRAHGTGLWGAAMKPILVSAYARLLERHTASMTSNRLLAAFRDVYGLRGPAIRSATSFFLHAAEDAGLLETSRLLASRRPSRSVKIAPSADEVGQTTHVRAGKESDRPSDIALLLSRLPEFDPSWPEDIQRLWFETYQDLTNRALANAALPERD